MSALIDTSNNRSNIAYAGETPWHGLGVLMPEAGTTLEQWKEAAGLTWCAKETPVLFQTDSDSGEAHVMDDRKVLYRSDTLMPLSVVGAGYKPVQPGQIVDFYEDLCDKHGFAMETMGALKQGKVIWALAKTGLRERLRGVDAIDAYLLLYTSYDQTSATVAKFTSIRVVCNNTLTMAAADHSKQAVSIRHDSEFNAAKVKVELRVGEAWQQHIEKLGALAELKVDPEQQVKFLLSVYHGLAGHEEVKPNVERTLKRLATILTSAPGAGFSTAKNTAYGLLQAVTYDVDHSTRSRSDDGRLTSAWMGAGEALKMKAYNYVTSLLEAA